jgi:hypothetical protein
MLFCGFLQYHLKWITVPPHITLSYFFSYPGDTSICYEHAINLHPGFGLAYLNKGKVLEQLAQQAYDRLKKQSQ